MADTKKKNPAVAGFVFGRTSLDVEALRQIVEVLEKSEVTRLDWTNGDERLYITRGPQESLPSAAPVIHHHNTGPATHTANAPAQIVVASEAPRPSAPARPTQPAAPEKKGHVITSPFVGTFYRTPAPDQPSFVDVGATVKKGQVLCIVEAMKLMNEIESEVAGRVAEILVENAQPVEFGQALFRIESA